MLGEGVILSHHGDGSVHAEDERRGLAGRSDEAGAVVVRYTISLKREV
jgi:hypothetical protein